jgi:hypothetical protein
MTCPDDARLDLWLDGALAGPAEAAAVGAHVAGCPACTARRVARLAEEQLWRAALALDARELAYLATADLAAAWRAGIVPAPPNTPARWWPALVLLGLFGAYAAWLLAVPILGEGAALAHRLGLTGLGLGWLMGRLWDLAAAIAAVAASPALANATLWLAGAAVLLWLLMARPAPIGRTS